MTSTQIAVIAIVVVAIIIVAVALFLRTRTRRLREQFGPEYNRAVQETGSKYKAEAELERVEKRVSRYPLHSLSSADRDRFQQSWRTLQSTFVDDPSGAISEADELLGAVMSARGYPVSDFQQRAEEIAVDHAFVVQHYRAGHEIAIRHAQRKATTEDLRQAMVHYRALFDDLIGQPERSRTRAAGMS